MDKGKKEMTRRQFAEALIRLFLPIFAQMNLMTFASAPSSYLNLLIGAIIALHVISTFLVLRDREDRRFYRELLRTPSPLDKIAKLILYPYLGYAFRYVHGLDQEQDRE
jgi:hypothetical protein